MKLSVSAYCQPTVSLLSAYCQPTVSMTGSDIGSNAGSSGTYEPNNVINPAKGLQCTCAVMKIHPELLNLKRNTTQQTQTDSELLNLKSNTTQETNTEDIEKSLSDERLKIMEKLSQITSCLDNSDIDRSSKHQELLAKVQLNSTTTSVQKISKAIETEFIKATNKYKTENDNCIRMIKNAHLEQVNQLKEHIQELKARIELDEQQLKKCKENCKEKIQETDIGNELFNMQESLDKTNHELTNTNARLIEANQRLIDMQRDLLQSNSELMEERQIVSDLKGELCRKSFEMEFLTHNLEQMKLENSTNSMKSAKEIQEVPVKFSEGKNPGLSAFDETPIEYEGQTYNTAEAALHTQKLKHIMCSLSDDEKKEIETELVNCKTGREAKEIGNKIPYNRHWVTESIVHMFKIIKCKYEQSPQFALELESTKGKRITHPVEDNMWRKAYPGILEFIRDDKSLTDFIQEFGELANGNAHKTGGASSRPRDNNAVIIGEHGKKEINWNLVINSKVVMFVDSTLNEVNSKGVHPSCIKIPCPTAAQLEILCKEFPQTSEVKAIISCLGINDLKDGKDDDCIRSIQSSLLHLQQVAPKANMMFSALLTRSGHPLCQMVTSVNNEMRRFCDANCMSYVKHADIVNNPELIPDGIHPSDPDGVRQLAADLRFSLPRHLSRRFPRSHSQPRRGGGSGGTKRGPRGRGSRK